MDCTSEPNPEADSSELSSSIPNSIFVTPPDFRLKMNSTFTGWTPISLLNIDPSPVIDFDITQPTPQALGGQETQEERRYKHGASQIFAFLWKDVVMQNGHIQSIAIGFQASVVFS